MNEMKDFIYEFENPYQQNIKKMANNEDSVQQPNVFFNDEYTSFKRTPLKQINNVSMYLKSNQNKSKIFFKLK